MSYVPYTLTVGSSDIDLESLSVALRGRCRSRRLPDIKWTRNHQDYRKLRVACLCNSAWRYPFPLDEIRVHGWMGHRPDS